jgi:signal transduction histidine kinase
MIELRDLISINLFDDLTDDELGWLLANTQEQMLAKGELFIREGDLADRFYIVLDGELQIVRSIDGKETVMGTTPRGIMGGELSILNGIRSNVTAYAIVPSRLLVFGLSAFRQLFAACPPLGTKVLQTAAQRMQGYASYLTQQEKMAALGKLSAGLAHELNNPAAAAQRAVQSLHDLLPAFQRRSLSLCIAGLNRDQIIGLADYQARVADRLSSLPALSTIERSDREDALGDWLEGHGVPDAWNRAAGMVAFGVSVEELAGLKAGLPDEAVGDSLAWLSESLGVGGLLDEIGLSTRRISELVGAVKSYTYMDQGQLQEVDINRDLANTLTVLGHKLRHGVTVIREYDSELPRIMGRGSELNQVWTNLIANAVEAMEGQGTLRVITRCEERFAMVEVADDGPGIAPEVLPRIFEPFFTTKGVGAGTGLGLDISYRVIRQHGGTIEVQSMPGNTRFIVRLPVAAA